jgi:transcription initiation factor TFIIB
MRPVAKTLVEEDHRCPECDSEHLVRDYTRGELVCDSCGLVVSEGHIDPGPEWTAYSVEESDRLARAGGPRSYMQKALGLSTVIPFATRDSRGNAIPFSERGKYFRMRKLQKHANHSRPGERSLPDVIRQLDRIASLLGLPRSVKEESTYIGKKALESGLLRGRSIDTLVAAAIYAACRISGVPRTLEEMAQATGLPKKSVAKAYGALQRGLKLRVPPSKAADYVPRFCSALKLSPEAEAEAYRILRRIEDAEGTSSLSPVGTAAAAIYLASLACGERRPQKAIARVAGVSEVTLRNRFRYLDDAYLDAVDLPRGRSPKIPEKPQEG